MFRGCRAGGYFLLFRKVLSSDKLVGSGLLLLSVTIFVYYTLWVFVLVRSNKVLLHFLALPFCVRLTAVRFPRVDLYSIGRAYIRAACGVAHQSSQRLHAYSVHRCLAVDRFAIAKYCLSACLSSV